MQMVAANVPKAVLSTMKSPYGARVPYAGSPHGKAAAFSRHCLSSLTWGHDGHTMCACVREWVNICVWWCLFFSVTAYCLISGHSPLSTWCLPLYEWLMCLSWWSRSDKTERSGKRRRIGWVCDGDRDKESAMIYWEVTFCLPSDAVGIQVVHLKCLHGWLIKSEKLLLLINWQVRPHMSAYSHLCRLHNAGPSAICVICLDLDFLGTLGKGLSPPLKLFHSYLKPLCQFFVMYAE